MLFRVELPQVGESVTEGVIGRWLVAEGERVDKYDPMVEVITDKVNIEMPSPVSGVVTRILAAEGETLPMGSVIAEIDAEGAQVQPPSAPADTLGTLVQGVAVGPTGAANVPQMDDGPPAGSIDRSPERPFTRSGAEPDRTGLRSSGKVRFSPAVRRLAEQHGVDPLLVDGTGVGGRVTRKDVERHIALGKASAGEPSAPVEVDRRLEISPIRKMIAENMVRSARGVPHAWAMIEVDVSGLVTLRKAMRDEFVAETGYPLTYLAFAVSAASGALRVHPMVNASWEGERIVAWGRVNVGIAVAAPAGLIVPVIQDADRKSVAELAVEIGRLSESARSESLAPEQVKGGTFTVNNTGALGSVISGPIIVPGQAAILTTEAVVRRPVVVGGDAIAVRSIMNMCVSFDHRLLDGSDIGAFLQSVRGSIESIGPGTSLDGALAVER